MKLSPWRILLLAALSLMTACASIVEGTEQSVTVITDPAGATCKMERAGRVVSIVNPTPGTARLDKSKENVSVICEKERYETAAAPIASEFQGMTFGNIIFGGLIGVAVDAGSGAMNKYPDSVSIVLAPKEFPSAADRDAFYGQVKANIAADAAKALAAVRKNCDPNNSAQCEAAVKEIEAKRDASVAQADARRLGAKVR